VCVCIAAQSMGELIRCISCWSWTRSRRVSHVTMEWTNGVRR